MNRSKQRPTLPERSKRYETTFRFNGRAGNIGGISIVRAGGDQDRNSRGPKRVRVYQGKRCTTRSADHLGWERRNNGGFSFNGPTPANCIGELRDGVSMINVQVLDCNSDCPRWALKGCPGRYLKMDPHSRQIMRLFEQAPVVSRVVV
jgi:hypothetical protein